MRLTILDGYLLREWVNIFLFSALGLPVFVIVIELAEKLDDYLIKDLEPSAIALAYFFSLPDRIFLILPAAVLFATVFSVGNMNRHTELTAAKASGRSVHRLVVPVLIGALVASGIGLLGELAQRTQGARYNFVYRAEEGWVYMVRQLNLTRRRMEGVVLAREGTGPDYPTLSIQAQRARYNDGTEKWSVTAERPLPPR
jgi:hypothetical protein